MDIIPSHLVERIFASLPPNYIAGTVRQISKDFRTAFTTKLIDVSQPVPPHALLWACSDDTLQRQLPLRHRLRLLALAVASCLDPEDLQLLGQTLSTLCGPVNGLDPKLYDPGIAAARAGNRAACVWLRSCNWPLSGLDLLCAAAEAAELPFLRWLHTTFLPQREPLNPLVCNAAAASPTPDAMHKLCWLITEGAPTESRTACAAALRGDLPMLRLLRSHPCAACCAPNSRTLQHALRGGHVPDVAEWMLSEGVLTLQHPYTLRHAAQGVALGGHLEALEWLLDKLDGELPEEHRADVVYDMFETCIAKGHAALLPWLLAHGAAPRAHFGSLRRAAESGSVETVRSLASLGCRDFEGAIAVAAERADVAMLSYFLDELGCKWDPSSQAVPALLGSPSPRAMDAVRWLLGRGCELQLDNDSVRRAAATGDLARVRWLLDERGCRVGPGAVVAAAQGGCRAVVDLLMERGAVRPAGGAAYTVAAQQGDLAMLEHLWGHVVPWGPDVMSVALGSRPHTPVAALRWLVGRGFPYNALQLHQQADRMGRPDVVEWLEGMGCSGRGMGLSGEEVLELLHEGCGEGKAGGRGGPGGRGEDSGAKPRRRRTCLAFLANTALGSRLRSRLGRPGGADRKLHSA